ncbi:MAG TPA: cellulase family glycosylhydrolase [Clostridia bacterium]
MKDKRIVKFFIFSLIAFFVLVSIPLSVLQPKADTLLAQENNFVAVRDGDFYLGEKEFRFVGTNNYYLHYKDNVMIDSVLDEAQKCGFNVIRMWGFFDGWTDNNHNNKAWMQPQAGVYTQPSGSKYDAYQNCWERMDYTLSQAAQKNIKLIIVFTNYWKDFGGLDQYLQWYNAQNETNLTTKDFYTNAGLKKMYKDYVSQVVNRVNTYNNIAYKDDPTIMAWELMNEPRNPVREGGSCQDTTKWAEEMSAYVKSLDNKHLVAMGDEGFFYQKTELAYNNNAKHVYDGSEGTDFDAILNIDTIDFGTYHLYPEGWGVDSNHMEWGIKWIQDHINSGKAAKKPVILEEFGINTSGGRNRELYYYEWAKAIYENDGAGLLFWMLAGKDTGDEAGADGNYPDYDGYRLLNNGQYPELEVLKEWSKIFRGSSAAFEDKVHMITPYLSSRQDENKDIRYLEIDSDVTPIYKVQAKILTKDKIKKVELYVDRRNFGKMKYNSNTGYYEYDLNMKYIYRGDFADLDVIALKQNGTKLQGERTRVKRALKYNYVDKYVANFDGETEPAGTYLSPYSTAAYNAKLNSIAWTPKGGGMTEIDCVVDNDSSWCELKILANRLEGLKDAYMLKFDVLMKENLIIPFTGNIPLEAESFESAPGFRHYAALDPGWTKIGLNENNVKYTDLEKITIDGETYLKQTVEIRYAAAASHTSLILGVVFNYVRYDGALYIDNLILQAREPVYSFQSDDYIDWEKEQHDKMIRTILISTLIPVGVIGILTSTFFLIRAKKKKSKQ